MIDINLVRKNPDLVKKKTSEKGYDPSIVDKVVEADEKRRGILKKVEELRSLKNKAAKEKNIEKGKETKVLLQDVEPKLAEAESELNQFLNSIPNLASDDTPIGRSEEDNVVIREWGTPPKFDFAPKDHVDLGKDLDIIDVEISAKVSGARFAYLKNEAASIQFALIQFAIETLTSREIVKEIAQSVGNNFDTPFIFIIPPVIMKSEVMQKMDRYDPPEERYVFEKDNMVFVGSAEHTLGPMYMDQTLLEKDLPIRYIGYSTAFRREAGSYGKDTRGILRVHQFDKLEMESFSTPEQGMKEHELMVAIQEYFMQKLNLPYQVMAISTGDMGKPDHKQIDINTWIPSQNKYCETQTADYMTDYQSRRLNTRVNVKGNIEYAHMNDATAFAIGRTLIAVLENNQQKDGSVNIPKVLQKYMAKEKIEKSTK